MATEEMGMPSHVPTVNRAKKREPIFDKALRFLSSVRFGIYLLLALMSLCMIGMLVMQQNMDGFREYYQRLTPSQQFLYGKLGFFDIYHSWHFSLLLVLTGVCIIFSSIDRFPAAWRYLRKPKLTAGPNFIRAQTFSAVAEIEEPPEIMAGNVAEAWRKHGLRPQISRDKGRITVFAQRHLWNRFGAYAIHLALLLIFAGGLLTSYYSVGGVMQITPGETTDSFIKVEHGLEGERVEKVRLPFAVECTDIRQPLIDAGGGLDPMNTLDWLSSAKIKDGGKDVPALIHMNAPFDYKGYRFFQSSYEPAGHARKVTVSFVPFRGGETREVTIPRNGVAEVEGVGRVSFVDFYPDFTVKGQSPATASGEYRNPVAHLLVTSPDGKTRPAFAFNEGLAEQYYSEANGGREQALLAAGNKVVLKSFEKVGTSHTLSVQYDPGRAPVYAGFVLMTAALFGVFLFSHRRVWAVVEPAGNGSRVYFGGNTNRNKDAFERQFQLLVAAVAGENAKPMS